MGISLNNPILLLLIPVLLFITYYFTGGLRNREKRTILTLRTLIIIFIILSIAGLGIKKYTKEISTIFLVDLSESAKDMEEDFKDFIKKSIENKSDKDKVGIVTFGRNSEIENPIKDNIKNVEFQTQVNGRFTNIEKGITTVTEVLKATF